MTSMIQALASFAPVHLSCVSPELPSSTRRWASQYGLSITVHKPVRKSGLGLWTQRIRTILAMDNLAIEPHLLASFSADIESYNPAILWLETPYLIRYALALKGSRRLLVDYWGTSQGQKRDYEYAHGLRKAWEYIRWLTFAGSERKYAPLLDDIVTVHDLDAQHFGGLAPDTRIHAVASGILDMPDSAWLGQQREDPDLLIITGDLSYRPNVDAAVYFAKEVFPAIVRNHPSARLRIVGKKPCEAVTQLRKAGSVEVKGYVPSLSGEIAESAVYVLPMRLGSGYRSKLFDVFPLAKPIVTTTTGAEGMPLIDRENCIVADTAESLAQSCVRLLKDAEERKRLGHACRRLATEVYTQANVKKHLRAVIAAKDPAHRYGT